jgi:hypothetical protein
MEHLEYLLARLPMRKAGATAMCRSVDNGFLGQDSSSRSTARKAHLFFDCHTKILDQMKSIGYLPGVWGAFTDGLRIQAASVSADDLDGRMVPQPFSCTLDTPVFQNVNNRATLEINDDGTV